MADDEDGKGYRWETEYERTWEAIQEDADGSLQSSVDGLLHRAKRKRLLEHRPNVRLGMMRHLFLVIDMSTAMEDQDLKPNRLFSTLKLLEHFIEEYFDQNPISQMGIIVTGNKRAEKLTELGGNPRRHITAVKALKEKTLQGEPSIQNSLQLAMDTLRNMPGHASREVLVIFGSLTTCDPTNIFSTVKNLKNQAVRVSIIGLAAEIRVCRMISTETQGCYDVILDESHYKDLLTKHLSPPPACTNSESSLIRMGFPHHQIQPGKDREEKPSMCMCHLDSKSSSQGFSSGGYFCPQCKSKYCELPVECKACGLTLVSAPHLARSYHHLFPLEAFHEVPNSELEDQHLRFCFSCQNHVAEQPMYSCGTCRHLFCIDCDLFVHETLHSCPGCAGARNTQQMAYMSVT